MLSSVTRKSSSEMYSCWAMVVTFVRSIVSFPAGRERRQKVILGSLGRCSSLSAVGLGWLGDWA